MADALVFTWSGSFRDDYGDRLDEIAALITFVRDKFEMDIGVLAEEERDTVMDELEALALDFVVGAVQDIAAVVTGIAGRYDRVFFVSDIRAELASVNQTGAFTIGYSSEARTADELGGVGPNYIVDDLDELQQILALEHMPG